MKFGLMFFPWLCYSSCVLQRGKTWRNCSEHKVTQPHQCTPRLWTSGAGKELGSCSVCRASPCLPPFIEESQSHFGPWTPLISPPGAVSRWGRVWYQLQNMPAKAAWIIFNSVPHQTPSVSQLFPGDYEKLCLPLLSLPTPQTLSKCK